MATRSSAVRYATSLLVTSACVVVFAPSAAAIPISITATAADRGADPSPRDGSFLSVFGNSDVVNMLTPPLGDLFPGEERGAVEFPLASIASGSMVLGATLLLSPTSTNVGLDASQVGHIHGYAGDGTVQPGDLVQMNLVGTIPGPTPNGQIAVPIDAMFIQSLVNGAAPFAGFMFKGDDVNFTVFGFLGTSSGIPVADRPTLVIEVQDSPVIPEPSTMLLVGSGLVALRLRSVARRRNKGH